MTSAQTQKNILVVHYSQTGQLNNVVKSVVSPLQSEPGLNVHFLEITPTTPYPFPWPFLTFINTFPEAIHEKGCDIKPIPASYNQTYDLVIIAYQVWFLAPSNPIMAFMKSVFAAQILKDTPVITVIACRDMWLQAQESMKMHLQNLHAKLVGNIALVDNTGSALSFFATPLWMLSGHKGPFKCGIPKAGVSQTDINNATRFGDAIVKRLTTDSLDASVLNGLGAVKINTNQIASEKIGKRSFKIWGKLFLLFGGPKSPARQVLAVVYTAFLILMIVTVVPANFLIKKALAPLLSKRNRNLREYYAQPSGENSD